MCGSHTSQNVCIKEYLDDVRKSMKTLELRDVPDPSRLKTRWKEREHLLDFVVQLHGYLRLLPSTLFSAINLVDRYLGQWVVAENHQQLLGCAALWIAAKFGDNRHHVPTAKELITYCGDGGGCASNYSTGLLIEMEWQIVQTLKWNIGCPTISEFLDLNEINSAENDESKTMALYIAELTLYYEYFMTVPASTIAKSSFTLAHLILNVQIDVGPQSDVERIWEVVSSMIERFLLPPSALSEKYSSPRLYSVAITMKEFLWRL